MLNSCQLRLGSEDSANFWNVSVHLDLGSRVVLCVLTPSGLIASFICQILIVQDTALLRAYMSGVPGRTAHTGAKNNSLLSRDCKPSTHTSVGLHRSETLRGSSLCLLNFWWLRQCWSADASFPSLLPSSCASVCLQDPGHKIRVSPSSVCP